MLRMLVMIVFIPMSAGLRIAIFSASDSDLYDVRAQPQRDRDSQVRRQGFRQLRVLWLQEHHILPELRGHLRSRVCRQGLRERLGIRHHRLLLFQCQRRLRQARLRKVLVMAMVSILISLLGMVNVFRSKDVQTGRKNAQSQT